MRRKENELEVRIAMLEAELAHAKRVLENLITALELASEVVDLHHDRIQKLEEKA